MGIRRQNLAIGGLVVACLIVASDVTAAPPELVLRTSGPAAPTRALAFSSDSQRLYAGGLDKQVHVWEVGWDAAVGGGPVVTIARPIHWERTRGDRGQIQAMALCPARREIIIGGAGARQQTGDLAIIDTARDEVAGSLPTPAERTGAASNQQIGSEGHVHMVTSLDYSPSGASIVSRDENGGMFVWHSSGPNRFAAQQLIAPGAAERFAPLARFVDERTIVYSRQLPSGDCQLIRRRLDTGGEVTFPEAYPRRVAALVRDTVADTWASADDLGSINVSLISDPNRRSLLRASLPHVTAMAIGGRHYLAVVSVSEIDGKVSRSIIDVFDLRTRARLVSWAIGQAELTRVVALSPDGRFVATINEDSQEVLVARLSELVAGKIDAAVTRVPATSRQVTKLLLSADGQTVAFGELATRTMNLLDLASGEIRPNRDNDSKWNDFTSSIPPGWKRSLLGEPAKALQITAPDQQTWVIELNPTTQGTIVSHCVLTDARNPSKVVGVAIGTENVNGVFVYRLDAADPALGGVPQATLVRWFRDHAAPVVTLLPIAASEVLWSGSRDRTVKLWSLDGLFGGPPPPAGAGEFTGETLWGCHFTIVGGRVVAQRVDPAGIAFAKGLRNGDEITRVQGVDRDNRDQFVDAVAGKQSGAEIIRVLDRVSVLEQVLINATPPSGNDAKPKAFIIRPAWQPVLTAFVDTRGDWAIWHPEGYFNASAAEGGALFQWMILRGQDQPPRLVEGGFLSPRFERPDLIRRLLAGESLADVLAANGLPIESPLEATIAAIPEVKVVSPEAGQVIASEQDATIVARIDFGTSAPAEYEIRGSIDAVRLGEPELRNLGDNRIEAIWRARPTGRLNQIEVLATQRGGALASFYSNDVVYRRGESDNPTPYQLHVLTLASEAYRGNLATQPDGFDELDYSIDDVESVVGGLQIKQRAGLAKYRIGEVVSLKDDQINPRSVTAAINQLNDAMASAVGPQLLVVYLSGHGTTIDGQYFYVTTTTPSTEPAAMKRDSLAWSLLARAGIEGCRVVTMIDTCHSGTAVDVKSSVRDPARGGSVVIAAASGREAAQEMADLGHGCFTYSVLLALDGEADGVGAPSAEETSTATTKDGLVDLEELIAFVQGLVPQLTKNEQTPSATPARLADVLHIPLVTKVTTD